MIPSQSSLQLAWWPRCTGPFLTIRLHGEGSVTVRPAIGDAVLALDACLRKWNYRTRRSDTGAGNCRPKVSGGGWSMHAYWIALDINWNSNPYGKRLITDMPIEMVRAICAIRTNNGKQVWNWGGFWRNNKDAMHFEIVCKPADIATGINPATVPGGSTRPKLKPIPVATKPTPVQPKPETHNRPVTPPVPVKRRKLMFLCKLKSELAVNSTERNRVWFSDGIERVHVRSAKSKDWYVWILARSGLPTETYEVDREFLDNLDVHMDATERLHFLADVFKAVRTHVLGIGGEETLLPRIKALLGR
jgi:hypothetical protein